MLIQDEIDRVEWEKQQKLQQQQARSNPALSESDWQQLTETFNAMPLERYEDIRKKEEM